MEFQATLNEEFSPNDISRCESCNLIPLYNLTYENGVPMISYECQNNHKNKLNLSEYIKNSTKNSIFNEKCFECQKQNCFFCSKCNKFICNECSSKHSNTNKHIVFQNLKFDSICCSHSNTFSSYCSNCKKNLCCFCVEKHKNHKIINFSDIIFSDDKINELTTKINELKDTINKIDEIKSNIIKELDKLKENNVNEIKFILDLFKTFQYQMKNNNINYNIIQNVKTFQSNLVLNKFYFFKELSTKSENFINFLKSIKNSKDFKSFQLKKKLQTHTGIVYHVACLQDGRLASCSQDKTIIIYNKDNFEPQIEINNIHNAQIFSFTQIEDGHIISCSEDTKMKVIELDKDKYSVVQSLEQHQGYVVKVIEFKKNELISISNDNTIKFWKKENDNFNCIKSIKFQNTQNYAVCIMKLNDEEFVTTDNGDGKLKFWNYKYYSMTKEFNEGISSNWNSTQLCLLNEDKFFFSSGSIYLFDIHSKNVIKKYNINTYSVIKCIDGTILLNSEKKLIKYKLLENELQKIDELGQNNTDTVYALAELTDGTIVLGYSNLIEIWN